MEEDHRIKIFHEEDNLSRPNNVSREEYNIQEPHNNWTIEEPTNPTPPMDQTPTPNDKYNLHTHSKEVD
jgi:hypothetical protein